VKLLLNPYASVLQVLSQATALTSPDTGNTIYWTDNPFRKGANAMPRLLSQVCLAAGACAVIAAAPVGSAGLLQIAGSNPGPLPAEATITETTPSTVPVVPIAVPAIKGPAPLPKEEQGLP
jgi:hypothetical protein